MMMYVFPMLMILALNLGKMAKIAGMLAPPHPAPPRPAPRKNRLPRPTPSRKKQALPRPAGRRMAKLIVNSKIKI